MTFDAFRFLKDYNIQYFTEGTNVSPGWVNIRCILCNDHSSHGGFNPQYGYYNCWRCGRHQLDLIVSKLLNISRSQARDVIYEYSGYYAVTKSLNKKRPTAKQLKLPGSTILSKFHKKYLQQRGFDPNYIQSKYGITATGPGEKWDGSDFSLRIIIPIYYQNQIISFQGRDITDRHKLRYKGCPIEKSVMNYKSILYNIDNCRGKRIVVTEGITDVWRMGDGFCASFGTAITRWQIKELNRYDEIFFLFDPEPEAQAKAQDVARQLASLGKYTEILILDSGKDPADLSDEEAEYLRKELL